MKYYDSIVIFPTFSVYFVSLVLSASPFSSKLVSLILTAACALLNDGRDCPGGIVRVCEGRLREHKNEHMLSGSLLATLLGCTQAQSWLSQTRPEIRYEQ